MGPRQLHLKIHPKADAELREKTPFLRRKISDAINKLAANPYDPEFSIPLKYGLSGLFRWTCGDFRIVYDVDESDNGILVWRIAHRSIVYESDPREK